MKAKVLDLAMDLCSIPSITGNEADVSAYLKRYFEKDELVVKSQSVGEDEHRANIFVHPKYNSPTILLTTHIDTVPPFIAPQIQDGKLIGRGTCDAKGIAAAMICAAEDLWEQGKKDIGLLFLVGEETTSDGAKAIGNFVPSVRYFINGEPTDLKLVSSSKGAIAFSLEAQGKPGHSAYPHTGYSALHQLIDDSHKLMHAHWPSDAGFGETTINFGTFSGGVAPNVIAASAHTSGVVRTAADAYKIRNQMESCLHPTTTLNIKSIYSPSKLHTVDGYDTCTVAFGSDIPHLSYLGTPLMIGPGSILDAHTAHEYVLIDDLYRAVEIYKNLVLKLGA